MLNSQNPCAIHQVALIEHSGPDHRINRISSKYQIPIISERQQSSYRYLLKFEDDMLMLTEAGGSKYRPIFVSCTNLRQLSRRTLLGRAIGRKAMSVVDATAGLGKDSLLLARMGYTVFAAERQPIVAALLEDGLTRAAAKSARLSIHCFFADARDLLNRLDAAPDVIYLDPMYPAGRKSTVKAARPIRVLRELAGDDVDADCLLAASLRNASRRVVVKRPHFVEPICGDRLTGSLSGKLVRYDFYQVN